MELPDTGAARIVAIASDDTWTHVYPTFGHLTNHDDVRHPPLGAMEFFDATGRRLAAGFDPTWRLTTLVPTADQPEPDRLRSRLQAVLRHLADYLRAHPEVVASLPDPPENIDKWSQALAEDTLDTIIRTIELQSGNDQRNGFRPLHSGGWLHNALHATGWTH